MNNIVTIITASYNYENYIKETIESVINQTYTNWEMIIVDDGSTDNSMKIIKSYTQKDSRIKLLTHENHKNCGLYKTLKLGIKEATGKYIVFLESDDTISANYIEEKLKIFKKYKQIGLVYNNINLFGVEDVDKLNYIANIEKIWKKSPMNKKCSDILYLWNIIPTFSCVMLKKELLNNIKYESAIQAWTDWYLWAQIAKKTEFYFLKEKLTNWRNHKTSYIHRTKLNSSQKLLFFSTLYKTLPEIKSLKYGFKIYLKMICRTIKFKLLQIIEKHEQ